MVMKPGQVLVFGAKTVKQPGTHAGPHLGVTPGVQFEAGAAVGGVRAVERAEYAKVVHMSGHMGEEFAHWKAALAVLFEAPRRLEEFPGGGKLDAGLCERKGLSVVALEEGLRVKGVDVAGAAFHEQKHDPLRPCGKGNGPRRKGIGGGNCRGIPGKQRLKRKVTKTSRAAFQQRAAG
jgi:hypothetical protein